MFRFEEPTYLYLLLLLPFLAAFYLYSIIGDGKRSASLAIRC